MGARAEHAEALALETCAVAGVDPWAPVDVQHVASGLGVAWSYTSLVPDGCFIRDAHGARILVKESLPHSRRRFALAHELGHYSLNTGLAHTDTARVVTRVFRSEEVFCNTYAGAMLIPSDWLWAVHPWAWSVGRETLADVAMIANDAGASLEATIVRLRECCGWASTIIHWKRRTQRKPGQSPWRLIAEAGMYAGRSFSVAPLASTGHALHAAAARGVHVQRDVALPLRVNGAEDALNCDLWIRGGDAVVLVRGQPARSSAEDPIELLAVALDAVFPDQDSVRGYVSAMSGRDFKASASLRGADAKTSCIETVARYVADRQTTHPQLLIRLLVGLGAMEDFPQLERRRDHRRRVARARLAVGRVRRFTDRAHGRIAPPASHVA